MDRDQTGPVSSLIWVYTVCRKVFLKPFKQTPKWMTFVVIVTLRVYRIKIRECSTLNIQPDKHRSR